MENVPSKKEDMYSFPTVTVSNDGSNLSICFNHLNAANDENNNKPASNENTSTFHAAWLWSNCLNHIHFTGARKYTPGQYDGLQIKEAKILLASTVKNDTISANLPIPPPPSDSCHPTPTPFMLSSSSNYTESKRVYFGNQTKNKSGNTSEQLLLQVTWNDSTSTDSYFDLGWLERWRYDDFALKRRRNRTEVKPFHALRRDDNLTHISYQDLIGKNKDDALFDLLHAIFTVGAAIITGAPTNEQDDDTTPVKLIADEIAGSPSHGYLYGDIFHVKSAPPSETTNNIAYTSEPLALHQDLSYYESVPGLQLLHCLKFGNQIVGGESILIDCMAAAEEFRRIAPHHFRTLLLCPATFVKQRDGVCMTYLRPHIVLKQNKKIKSYSNIDDWDDDDFWKGEIVAVNWSPPFEGPLCVPYDMVSPYYAAYSAFEKMLDITLLDTKDEIPKKKESMVQSNDVLQNYAKRFTWKHRLNPGEILVFNNRRMLHGRIGYEITQNFHLDPSSKGSTSNTLSESRHFVGTYTNIDESLNKYRVLLRDRVGQVETSFNNVGNGTSIVP